DRHGAAKRAEHAPVLGGRRIEIPRRPETSGAAHILRHDGRPPGNILAHMARYLAGVEIIPAAHAVADHQAHALSAVEILHALGGGRMCQDTQQREREACTGGSTVTVAHNGACSLRLMNVMSPGAVSSRFHMRGKMCGNLAVSRARRSPLTSTTVGNVPPSFLS